MEILVAVGLLSVVWVWIALNRTIDRAAAKHVFRRGEHAEFESLRKGLQIPSVLGPVKATDLAVAALPAAWKVNPTESGVLASRNGMTIQLLAAPVSGGSVLKVNMVKWVEIDGVGKGSVFLRPTFEAIESALRFFVQRPDGSAAVDL